jgi:hypothetical protein
LRSSDTTDLEHGRLSPSYLEGLDRFIKERCVQNRRPNVVTTFHAVRSIPYYSSGDRTPEAVLRDGRGACTAKHLLLRDLLRRQGEAAEVEIVEGDFAAAIPEAASMPEALRRWIRSGGITDFHCYVVWVVDGHELKLDATWPDSLIPYGFPVNSDWSGEGDTQLGVRIAAVKARVDNVIVRKEALLATLSPRDAANRRIFLTLLSEWLAGFE